MLHPSDSQRCEMIMRGGAIHVLQSPKSTTEWAKDIDVPSRLTSEVVVVMGAETFRHKLNAFGIFRDNLTAHLRDPLASDELVRICS